jgi:Mg2+ and Co2+ transporter CorA
VSAGDPARARTGPGTRRAELPRSIFVPQEDPREELREAVDAILSDAFMGFLALLLVPIILLPLLVSLPSTVGDLLNAGDVTIIGFFVVEYAAKLYLARDRWAYARAPWHLLDLVVILLSLASYVPLFGLSGRGSAILLVRLLRLPRLFAVGGRAVQGRLAREEEAVPELPPEPVALIRQVDASHPKAPRELTWEELAGHLASATPEWIHLSNVSEGSLLRLSALLQVHESHFRYRLLDDLWPHISRVERTVLLFLQTGEIRYPKRSQDYYTVARHGAIIVLQGAKVVSVSPHGVDPIPRVLEALQSSAPVASGFQIQVVEGILDTQLRQYRTLLAEIELEIGGIARTPRRHLPGDFLARVYEFNKAIVRLTTNISHFREVLGRILSGRVAVPGLDEPARGHLEGLSDEAGYLSDTVKEAADQLGTIIDVYVNQSSFETNRVLKILAVITAVAIIPATVGGLLGIDGPYDFVLWQVLLVISLSMLFVSYCFLRLGWLRA